MVDVETVRARLRILDRNFRRLVPYLDMPLHDFLASEDAQDIVEHNLRLAVQACIDIAAHVLADGGFRVPNTYKELFSEMARAGWVQGDLASRLGGAAGFRNVLVHEYAALDLGKVYDHLQHLDDLRAFAAAVLTRLDA